MAKNTFVAEVTFNYMKSLQALKQCDLKSLLYHLAIHLCIATGQRDLTLLYMNTDLMMFKANEVTISVLELLKQ